jgi:hypothetical protein
VALILTSPSLSHLLLRSLDLNLLILSIGWSFIYRIALSCDWQLTIIRLLFTLIINHILFLLRWWLKLVCSSWMFSARIVSSIVNKDTIYFYSCCTALKCQLCVRYQQNVFSMYILNRNGENVYLWRTSLLILILMVCNLTWALLIPVQFIKYWSFCMLSNVFLIINKAYKYPFVDHSVFIRVIAYNIMFLLCLGCSWN